jgi:hypothetical protein
VEETAEPGEPGEKYLLPSHWQTLSHNVILPEWDSYLQR